MNHFGFGALASQASTASAPRPAPRYDEPAGLPFSLRNWRVSWRLIALVAVPMAMGMFFAGLRVSTTVGDAGTYGRVQRLAALGQQATGLAQALQDEYYATVTYLADGRTATGLAALREQYAMTDSWAARVEPIARSLGPGYPAPTLSAATTVLTGIAGIPQLRILATAGHAAVQGVVTDYSQVSADLFALDDDIAREGGDASLGIEVQVLGSLSRMKDQAAQQRALLYAAFRSGHFAPGELNAVIAAAAQQASDLASFGAAATLTERESFSKALVGGPIAQAAALERGAVAAGASGAALSSADAPVWAAGKTDEIGQMRRFEARLSAAILARAQASHLGAEHSAQLTLVAALIFLIGVVLSAVVIAGSMVRPLRRLHAGALEVATVRLPREVQQLSQLTQIRDSAEDLALVIEPIAVHSTDEVGRVARVFDQVHREAVRLAAEEARLRNSVSAMVVSLSRRSQSLLERLLRLIDTLELGEEDPERLAHLFRMDHLATRMRRHTENMLVLAGHESSRRLAGSVPLVDVIRASISEVEQYDRVAIDVQPGVTLAGSSVADVVHLLAELIENATTFSARTTQVDVTANTLSTGGVLVSVTDSGMGMTADQLEHMNWRLEHPPAADVEVSRHMGLFAVAHLAKRHGIRVRLQATSADGVSAQVWFPDALTRPRGDVLTPAGTGSLRLPVDAAATAMAASFPADADWFRASGWKLPQEDEFPDPAEPTQPEPAQPEPESAGAPAANSGWPDPGDDGWRAAAAAVSPSSGGFMASGLPIRVPGANLVPGSAGGPAAQAARRVQLARSAEAARSQLAKFQRGSRRARAAAPENLAPSAGAPSAGGAPDATESALARAPADPDGLPPPDAVPVADPVI